MHNRHKMCNHPTKGHDAGPKNLGEKYEMIEIDIFEVKDRNRCF